MDQCNFLIIKPALIKKQGHQNDTTCKDMKVGNQKRCDLTFNKELIKKAESGLRVQDDIDKNACKINKFYSASQNPHNKEKD